ncbi:hypothetical protein SZ64_15415 [Erythrobacter sp. SG61-1L]|uniref:hypothetical protein n=1 Tax=Erythrobacter sp. SG61-1L TaxID=1603897 RepID=UPI0006C92A74|nr:hypothetical protein [Erythrobacter sp. SG61-1L]KPL69373.1 hypothetical protein SZ64_15415 [Erythrobacter sp. SG61-1L]
MKIFAKGACLLVAALALPAPGHAQDQDLAAFLSGRWGDAGSDWKDLPEDFIYAPCRLGHPRADSAYVFSGDLAHLEVQSNGSQDVATRREPVVSSVSLGGQIDPATVPGFEDASYVLPILFERRGLFKDREFFAGMIAIVADDRIALISPRADSEPDDISYLVRCNGR